MQRWLAALLLGCMALTVEAQSWPAKPIRFILPTPAGTSPDAIGRLLADKLSRALGQSVEIGRAHV